MDPRKRQPADPTPIRRCSAWAWHHAHGQFIPQASSKLIEINSATQEELESLPSIGPATALKIIAYHEENGNFKTTEEIMDVSGIGLATFERIKDLIAVSD